MATVDGNKIVLDFKSGKDAALLAKAIRDSVFHGLEVKGFMDSEAVDVLRYLHAIIVSGGRCEEDRRKYELG